MTTQTTHTPTPWTYLKAKHLSGPERSQDFGIIGADNQIIAETFEKMSWTVSAPAEANAAHIVRCVNEREELLGVLRALDCWPDSWREDGMLPIFKKVEQVLARVKQED